MARTIFIYGLVAGVIVLMLMGAGMAVLGFDHGAIGMIWGVGAMIVGLSVMIIGVRRYAASRRGIGFGRAFLLALAIALVASLIYVLGWELYLAATGYRFADDYASQMIAAKVAEGANPAQLAAMQAQMTAFKADYANPLLRVPLTFSEIAPVGLVMALIAALTLRTRSDDERIA